MNERQPYLLTLGENIGVLGVNQLSIQLSLDEPGGGVREALVVGLHALSERKQVRLVVNQRQQFEQE